MAYQALARKWRPQSFRDIIGQQTTVRTLQNAIEQKRIHHAYLFSGVRGVGKTTTARILAKALNCEKGPAAEPCNVCTICREITEGIDLDVREIDAATYSKAEDVREIREVLQFQPARDRYRIFIIDEVHSLSGQAWNALLKQIEEPPPHVVFMMATTEMQKVPATILSRVQQFALRKITHDELRSRLEEICRDEGLEVERDVLDLVVRRGEGSVRDSLSLLDQLIAFGGRTLTLADAASILGVSDSAFFGRLVDAIEAGDPGAVLEEIDVAAEGGRDLGILYRDLLAYLRNLLLLSGGAPERMIAASEADLEVLHGQAARFSYAEILRMLSVLIRDDETVNRSEAQRLAVEVAILKAATLPRLRSVEDALAGGGGAAVAPQAPAARLQKSGPPKSAAPPPAGPDDIAARLMAAVARQRRATATYLERAGSIRLEDGKLAIEFDAGDEFAADYVKETAQAQFLAETAAGIAGHPVTVHVAIRNAASPRPDPARPAAQDDPVLRSFQRHLGGEVVQRKPAGKQERER